MEETIYIFFLFASPFPKHSDLVSINKTPRRKYIERKNCFASNGGENIRFSGRGTENKAEKPIRKQLTRQIFLVESVTVLLASATKR